MLFSIQNELMQEEKMQKPPEIIPMTWNCIGCTFENQYLI